MLFPAPEARLPPQVPLFLPTPGTGKSLPQEEAYSYCCKTPIIQERFSKSLYSLSDPLWQVTDLWEYEGCHSSPLTPPISQPNSPSGFLCQWGEFPLHPGSPALCHQCGSETFKVVLKRTPALPMERTEQASVSAPPIWGSETITESLGRKFTLTLNVSPKVTVKIYIELLLHAKHAFYTPYLIQSYEIHFKIISISQIKKAK